MREETFYKILKEWQDYKGNKPFWKEKASELGYNSAEALRSDFKRERKKRDVKKQISIPEIPNVGVVDIEISPLKVFTFGLWEQNITTEKIIQDSYMISWAGKMLNNPEVFSGILSPEESRNQDDYRIVDSLWNFLNQCDIVIGHNVKDFDLKKINTRFLIHGFVPVSNFSVIDTLLIARNNFSFSSNSLKYINQVLGIKQKIENDGFILWKKCMDGDKESLQKMLEYNIGDVMATEDLYYKIRPFMKGHPNMAVFFEGEESRCPKCGSLDLTFNGFYYTPAGKYDSVRCVECGAVGRLKTNHLNIKKRKNLVVN